MLTITAETASLVAQLVSVVTFAAIVELRRAIEKQTLWELWGLVIAEFVLGAILVSSMLVSLIRIVSNDGETIEFNGPIELWIIVQFTFPLFALGTALALNGVGRDTALDAAKPVKRTWAMVELAEALRRNVSGGR